VLDTSVKASPLYRSAICSLYYHERDAWILAKESITIEQSPVKARAQITKVPITFVGDRRHGVGFGIKTISDLMVNGNKSQLVTAFQRKGSPEKKHCNPQI